MTEGNGLLLSCELSLIAVVIFFLSSFAIFLFCFVLFSFFRDDASLYLFNIIFKELILHIFFIIMIIIRLSARGLGSQARKIGSPK